MEALPPLPARSRLPRSNDPAGKPRAGPLANRGAIGPKRCESGAEPSRERPSRQLNRSLSRNEDPDGLAIPLGALIFSDVDEWFRRFAHATAEAVGRSQAFLGAIAVIVLWGASGPLFHFSDTWQLVINTGTTVITFLMVFLIQNTQNRDAHAIHLKLDELIRANSHARNALLGLESMSDAELERLQREFERLRDRVAAARESNVGVRNSRRSVE